MIRPASIVLLLAGALALGLSAPPAGSAPTITLRLDGVGPLKLGMKRSAALQTGWLAGRKKGCELGGPPVPLTYAFTGQDAPDGLVGGVEFVRDRLRSMTFTKGVRTTAGVVVRTTTLSGMVKRYREQGYAAKAQYSSTFGGTFASVKKGGKDVIGGFGSGTRVTTLAIPAVGVCE